MHNTKKSSMLQDVCDSNNWYFALLIVSIVCLVYWSSLTVLQAGGGDQRPEERQEQKAQHHASATHTHTHTRQGIHTSLQITTIQFMSTSSAFQVQVKVNFICIAH